jgi:elongation factor G
MGELHLDVLVTRIVRDYGLEARIGRPQVTYRESIAQAAEHTETFERVLAGKENTATITLTVEPHPRGTGNSFESLVPEHALPKELQEAVRRGVEGSLSSGIAVGYPAIDIKVTMTRAVYDETTATTFAYEACGAMCLDAACSKAGPLLLEPIMKVDVMSPNEFMGEVIQGITMRGGIVNSVESKPAVEHIRASAPLAAMFGYSTALRSVSQGRATYAMEFSHFEKKSGDS